MCNICNEKREFCVTLRFKLLYVDYILHILISDETNGKTALMKALLNLEDGKNDCIEVLLDIAVKTGDLGNFINASYKDHRYKGKKMKTATHQP